MPAELKRLLETERFSPEEIAAKGRRIYDNVLRRSRCLRTGNFTAIEPADLGHLFTEYDRQFFDGRFRGALAEAPLRFRVSSRMTRAGGMTTRIGPRRAAGPKSYEIAVSATLLFQAFHDVARPITVTGLLCQDRLQALQRIFEHELVHLAEMLVWTDSSCRGPRFQSIAGNFFGHTEHTHQLVTPRERALVKFGIRPGSRVRFRLDGIEYTGIVNRVTRRATVLVPDPRGQRYSDGRSYRKFYVPLTMLELAEPL